MHIDYCTHIPAYHRHERIVVAVDDQLTITRSCRYVMHKVGRSRLSGSLRGGWIGRSACLVLSQPATGSSWDTSFGAPVKLMQ